MSKRAQLVVGLVFNTIVILVISKLSTGSLNPLEVFGGESLLLKIFVGFLLVMLFFNFISILIAGSLKDKRCSKAMCGKPLVPFADALGQPVRCRLCGRWFHSRCIKANGGSALQGCREAGCSSAPAQAPPSDFV